MTSLIKPHKLSEGDTIATISLSGGAAGEVDLLQWHNLSKKRLQEDFKLNVVETLHSLKGRKYIYENPKSRAEDLMEALLNPEIRGIFLNQGGDDAIRILPYVDFKVIKNNPKIFLGFSDATTIHYMFYKAGISSFYGANSLTTLSEPVKLHSYTEKWIKKVLFDTSPIGNIEPAEYWTNEPIDWKNGINEERKMIKNNGYELLQGKGKITGKLLGGCIGPLVYMVKGSCLFPEKEAWEGSIIFFDGMAAYSNPSSLTHMLRSLASTGIFKKANGIIFSNPVDYKFYEECKQCLFKVIRDEEGLLDMPILYNLNFGHSTPITTIPFGAMAEIDCDNKTFSILESGVV